MIETLKGPRLDVLEAQAPNMQGRFEIPTALRESGIEFSKNPREAFSGFEALVQNFGSTAPSQSTFSTGGAEDLKTSAFINELAGLVFKLLGYSALIAIPLALIAFVVLVYASVNGMLPG